MVKEFPRQRNIRQKNLQKCLWVCFVLNVYCWAGDLPVGVVLGETSWEKPIFTFWAVVNWRWLLGWEGEIVPTIVFGFSLGLQLIYPQMLGYPNLVGHGFHLIEWSLDLIRSWLVTPTFVLKCTSMSCRQVTIVNGKVCSRVFTSSAILKR